MQVYAHWYVSWPSSVLSIESPRSRALGAKGGACPSSLDRIPKAWSTFGMKHGAEGVSKHSRPRGFDRERTTWGSPHQFAGFWKFEKYFLVLKNHASSPSTPDLGDSIENRTDFRNLFHLHFLDFWNFNIFFEIPKNDGESGCYRSNPHGLEYIFEISKIQKMKGKLYTPDLGDSRTKPVSFPSIFHFGKFIFLVLQPSLSLAPFSSLFITNSCLQTRPKLCPLNFAEEQRQARVNLVVLEYEFRSPSSCLEATISCIGSKFLLWTLYSSPFEGKEVKKRMWKNVQIHLDHRWYFCAERIMMA